MPVHFYPVAVIIVFILFPLFAYGNSDMKLIEVHDGDTVTLSYKNGKKVKVKINTGEVGVAICADGDKFDLEKGIEIARMRAVIKHLEKQIKKLSK